MSDEFSKTLTALCLLAFAATPEIAFTQTPAQPAARAEEPIGRLFFTPAQRASLDVARTRRARASLNNEEEQNTPVAQSLTYSGMVRRSDGKSTMWVNNRALSDSEPVTGSIIGRVRPNGSITLQLPQSGRSVDLKPGQRIELLSGVVEEAYSRRSVQPEPNPAVKTPIEQKAASPERIADRQRQLQEAVRTLQEAAAKGETIPVPPQETPSR